MRVHLICIVYLMISNGVAQTHNGKVVPKITTLPIEDGEVTVLRLSPGYATSVRLPEEITSVMIGNPASFKAEHSEYEPRLVFLKPTTNQPAESNALITTKSGHQVSLHLVSAGSEAVNQRVDFVVEYRRPRSLLVGQENPSVLIGETQPTGNGDSGYPQQPLDVAEQELEKQKGISSPTWTGKEMQVAIGNSTERDHQMVLAFSVLNSSNRAIELLPPQLQLSGSANGTERIKSEPVPVIEYRVTARRLEPGQRADGVVVFDRPNFKESREHLEFELAQADKVDQPVVVPIPFTAINGEVK